MTMTKSTTKRAVTTAYKLQPEEQAVIKAALKRHRARAPCPRFKVEQKGNATKLVIDHPDPEIGGTLLMEALGTTSLDFMNALVNQLVNAGSKGQAADANGVNFMLAVITGLEPKNEVEALLATQV